MLEQHYKLSEAGKLISVSTRTLRRWINDGKIKAAMWDSPRGKEYRIAESELVRFGDFKRKNNRPSPTKQAP